MALEHSFRSKSFAKCWRTLSSIAAFMQQQQQTGSTEHSFLVAIDVMFVVAATYWLVCIRPMPKTYLSEIIFPLQFYLRGVASLWLTLVTALVCVYTLGWGGCPDLDERPVALLTTDTAAWGVSTLLIWMEHRRGLRTSPLLLGFWLLRWSLLTKSLWMRVTPQVVGSDSPPFVVVLHMGCLFLCQSVLASAGIWPTRQLTSSSPEVLALARAHIISFSATSHPHKLWFDWPSQNLELCYYPPARCHVALPPNVEDLHSKLDSVTEVRVFVCVVQDSHHVGARRDLECAPSVQRLCPFAPWAPVMDDRPCALSRQIALAALCTSGH
ncbi:hypothetical protein, variant 11 [Aphanomyces astaci]|uniref:Uncharacterized protein n=1 Tax=Aphanomyces astaci TaxID=112090 RepID=W4FJ20_APHAT|nr:hypothetical protein, variant 8 [Aphanomyces astaci]XP_009843633.1 hypothetical protein, variant 9 [Aphanomyces astaci]XP_009843634.1 hypothetical protein, variant 10 [Aphanomyces astaci]XP_009843635.1 hypothetical protein, variant 11 [Aphanomyces astaci]ETV66829.1 hypothetical protein, variant 8 [Aphanomyces astaci]ETV66830.1 hypothetical protein, variant 9 [Aphanomyces astaci]ETV66831.1 hypothetical protein, variant 10 [Aphanomyces astaci]ETV66832.1 hypothetical protein, variant 11 [Aph|eukprot:XP_009843632.1 hypothetical protein, variant 8 [Aphanomyces astaci]